MANLRAHDRRLARGVVRRTGILAHVRWTEATWPLESLHGMTEAVSFG